MVWRVGVFVDAGYVYGAGGTLLAKKKVERKYLTLNEEAAFASFNAFATTYCGCQLLRVVKGNGAACSTAAPCAGKATERPPAERFRAGAAIRHQQTEGLLRCTLYPPVTT